MSGRARRVRALTCGPRPSWPSGTMLFDRWTLAALKRHYACSSSPADLSLNLDDLRFDVVRAVNRVTIVAAMMRRPRP